MFEKKLFSIVVLLIISLASESQVKGKITNNLSQPVAGAFVHLLNTNAETYSDAFGNYILTGITPGEYIVAVSASGYAIVNKNVVVSASGTDLNIRLTNALIQLDAVVVTAQKKEELLQNVPLSATAISAKQVQEYRLWNSKDLTALSPNLFSDNSGDERNVTSIRGIVTTSYDPAVATYIDGVNQFSLDTYIAGLNDIERIEILRGPQGTLYGRNAMGGVINIITKKPTNETKGFVELNAGNYGMQRYTAGIQLPVIKNKLFFGASLMYRNRNGYYTNDFNQTSFDRQDGILGNYYLRYMPGNSWNISLNVKHQNNQNNGAFPMVNGVDDAFKNPFKLSQDATAKMIDNTMNGSLTFNHSGPAVNFTSISAWQQNHRYYDGPLDGDFSPADAVTIINNYPGKWNKVKVFTQEIRLSSGASKSEPIKWTAGTYFFHQDNPTKQATHFGNDATLLGAPDINFSTINTTIAKNTGIAFYGQATYTIVKKLDLIAGLRYDHEEKILEVEGEYQKDGGTAFVTRADTSGRGNFNAFSPKLGLNYDVSANNSLYLTYSRGYRTGGLTQLSSDPSQPPLFPYQPEYSNNFEAGSKNTFFNDRLLLNATLFLTAVTNTQVPTLILPDAITVTKNTGKLTSKGAEVQLVAAPFEGLHVDYNFGYTNAKYTSLKVSQNGEAVDLHGKKQIFTPAYTSMFAIQYSFDLGIKNGMKVITRVELKSLGTQYFDLNNTIKQSPYSLINLRLGVSSKNYGIFLWSRNTGNKKYISYAYDFGAVHLGDPQTYGVTVTGNF